MRYLIAFLFLSIGAKAQVEKPITIICIKGDSTKHLTTTSFVDVVPPGRRDFLPQQFGYFIRSGKPIFNFRWLKNDNSKLDLSGNLFIKSIIVSLDNDSLVVFNPGYHTTIEQKKYLDIEADITIDQLKAFCNHKMVSITLVADKHLQYDLFTFNEEQQMAIKKASAWFESNYNNRF